jgi:hypothetical protein
MVPGPHRNSLLQPPTYLRNIETGKSKKESWYQYIFPRSLPGNEGATVREEVLSQANIHAQLASKFVLAS